MQDELPIIQTFIKLYKQFYGYRKTFPKQDRHLLGAHCEEYLIQILELLLKAKFANRQTKLQIIQKASENFDLLKVFIRLLDELRIIDQRKYLILERQMQEIGKMLGGWLKRHQPNQNEPFSKGPL